MSAHADGERRGLDRIGGERRKGLGETRLQAPSDRHRPSAIAVGVRRDVEKKTPRSPMFARINLEIDHASSISFNSNGGYIVQISYGILVMADTSYKSVMAY